MNPDITIARSELIESFAIVEKPSRQGRTLDASTPSERITGRQELRERCNQSGHGEHYVGVDPNMSTGLPQLPRSGLIWDKASMSSKPETLADRVQSRMDALGLNPFSTAKRAKLKSGYVHDLLRGKVLNPGADKLRALAIALEASSAYLLDGTADAPVYVVDHEGNTIQPEMGRLKGDGSLALPVVDVLPIRHELAAFVWRSAKDVTDRPLGFEASVRLPELGKRDVWFEYMRDDSMREVVPKGSIVQVAELFAGDETSLADGDIVVVVKRLFVGEPEMHLVERSLRRIRHYMPEHGLWMYELASGDPETDWTDETFRQDELQVPPKDAPNRSVPPPGGALSLDPKIREALDRLENPEFRKQMEAAWESFADRRPRIAGRVISARVPLGRDIKFV